MSFIIPPEDIPELQSIATQHADFRTRRAAKAILALHESDKTKTGIADSLGINRSTLFRIQSRYQKYGIEGLISDKVGRPPLVTEAYRRELDTALQTHPRALGLGDELSWTAHMLVDYMHEKTDIEISVWSMRDLLHQLGYVYEWKRVIVSVEGHTRHWSRKSWKKDKTLEDRYS